MDELEKIVRQLESGDMPLDESLKLFEDGVSIARKCRERLAQAERRIEVLMKDPDGELRLEDLDAEVRAGSQPRVKKRISFEEADDEPF